MSQRLKVALLIESSRAYGRGLLRGIASFVRSHGLWSIYHQERSLADDAPAWLSGLQCDGIIARVETESLGRAIRELGVPAVDLRGRLLLENVPLIETNDREVMRLAVDHLRERGFTEFAFCGFPGANYSEKRQQALEELLKHHGLKLHLYESDASFRQDDTQTIERRGITDEARIGHWIAQLPRPVALIACNDIRAQQVLGICRERDIAVPDDIAVMGVDNDDVLCELCEPPLSSVKPDTEKIGYEAAYMLSEMLNGNTPSPISFIDPVGVVARQSTDALAIADREVAQAMRFIRLYACDAIDVEDVVKEVSISRSSLERRFRTALDTTPNAEINRVRLARVKRLLAETDYRLQKIADLTGFAHAEYLNVSFKKALGCTPGEFRKQHRS